MADFPHLSLKQKLDGDYQFVGKRIEKEVNEITASNLNDRKSHGDNLKSSSESLVDAHINFLKERKEAGLPDLFSQEIIPIYLQVDPTSFEIESLHGFGIEIVSEENDGYIIGASVDKLRSLNEKIEGFVNEKHGAKNTALLWQIIQGTQWRIENILSDELRIKYYNGISDEENFTLDISIACYLRYPDRPVRQKAESDESYAEYTDKFKSKYPEKKIRKQRVLESDDSYQKRILRWEQTIIKIDITRDEIAIQRQDFLTNFIENIYGGNVLSSFIDLNDSFGFRATMSGKAFKDLLLSYPYVFEISESENIDTENHEFEIEGLNDIEIQPPTDDSPMICIIDSGIQEKHILLSSSIKSEFSKNYVPYENTTSDLVKNGGHGTKVAGAVIFGNNIPTTGTYQSPCFVLNARVLDNNCTLPDSLYPPELMEQIVEDFSNVQIFNLSIATRVASRITHMSAWAASLDKLIHENGVLFILATGNVIDKSVINHLKEKLDYPDFLLTPSSRISNPSQSLLGLTVGSVCIKEYEDKDRISFGKKGHISPFSRSGPGIWGSIKPDVVEYGGDWLREKNGYLLTIGSDTASTLVKTGANGIGFDIGTSFSTPKVAHIVALLAKNFPYESTLFYKALVIQSARLPEHVFYNPTSDALKLLGYGIPDVNRAIQNSSYRITFVAEGSVAAQQANLYSVNIPEEIRKAGDNFDILVEVTLTYTALPRRTRKKLKSYFSTWLSWESSKIGETFEAFASRVLKNIDNPEEENNEDTSSIKWTIWSSPNWGLINYFKRQDSSTQKDWVILKSNNLPQELSFAVIGHKGWDKDTTNEMPFVLAISFEAISKEIDIYERIELANRIEIQEAIAIQV